MDVLNSFVRDMIGSSEESVRESLLSVKGVGRVSIRGAFRTRETFRSGRVLS